jgi:serine/threonine protein kinase
MEQGNPFGTAHYGLIAHYGIGVSEDLDVAADHYEIAARGNSVYLTQNAFRCLRSLNKGRLGRSHFLSLGNERFHHDRRLDQSASSEHYRVSSVGLRESGGRKVGGYGTVTFGTDPKTGERIAIKRLTSVTKRCDSDREVTNLRALSHPCVVRFLGCSPDNCEIYMEWADHGSLKDVLDRPYEHQEVWNPTRLGIIICDLVLGMRYIHSRGLIHRDFKPGNILLHRDWSGLISDFGVSRFESTEGPQTINPGTVWYAAPELLIENCPQTTKTDVFAFGLILFELLTWQPVFTADLSLMTIHRRLSCGDLPALPRNWGDFVCNLIARCWSKDPNSRPSFDDILNEIRLQEFAILPGADSSAIREAVSEVHRQEREAKAAIGDLLVGDDPGIEHQESLWRT